MIKKKILLLILFSNFFVPLSANANSKIIKSIEFQGNEGTSEEILNSITELSVGDEYSSSKIEHAVQNLKNTTVFSQVQVEQNQDIKNPSEINIIFKMEKKWTIIPYFIFGSGGGSTYYSVGLFDSNLFNQLYTTNLNFKLENEKQNFSLSIIDNYAFNNKAILGITSNLTNKKEIFFNSDGNEFGFMTYKGVVLNPYLLLKITDLFNLGGGIIYHEISEVNNSLTSDELNTNKQNNLNNPNSFTSVSIQTRFNLGKINHDDITQKGILISSVTDSTAGINITNSSSKDYAQSTNTMLGFYPIYFLKNSYIATRLGLSITDSDNPINQYYIGGLDKLRGFNYSQFYGKTALYFNFEFRYTAWEGNYVALQIVPFFDAANTGNDLNQIFSQKSASSYGIGLRVPLKRVNRIAARIDYATTITPFIKNGISFGLIQFF